MKISVNWLRRYVDVDWDADEIARRLTLSGLEVEDVHDARPAFDGVRVGKVLTAAPHPGADRLQVAQVESGGQVFDVVCGAPNCRPGLTVAYAPLGATLPDGTQIRAAQIRGVDSAGMLCSESELGISQAGEGIVELDGGLITGADLMAALDLDDRVLEIGVTANRGDALSHLGVAREVAALAGVAVKWPDLSLPAAVDADPVPVEILAPDQCARYVARVIRGLKVGPSPLWMRRLLTLVGVRPINNLVDVTNFVLFEYGQPLHAFDLRYVRGRRIRVRAAAAGEQMATLDGVVRTFTAEDLLICDGEGPVAVAGVMGGLDSEVKPDTTDVLLESAWFEPASVRMTSRRLGLRSESSHRFERSVDPGRTDDAARRALHLFTQLSAPGSTPVVEAPHTDVQARPVPRAKIIFDPARTERLLGLAVPPATQREALTRFGFEVTEQDGAWAVQTPSFRGDVDEPADLIEEVARYVGYDAIPTPAPRVTASSGAGHARDQRVRALRRTLTTRGVHQALNFSFLSEGLQAHFETEPAMRLVNPLTEDHRVLRRSLTARLVANAAHNLRHGERSVGLFEVGKVFFPAGDGLPVEVERVAVVLAGDRPPHWSTGKGEVDFFDLKGLTEDLVAQTGRTAALTPTTVSWMIPGAAAEVTADGVRVGVVGALHPRVAQALGIEAPVFAAELDLGPLVDGAAPLSQFVDFGRYPTSVRDASVRLPNSVTAAQVLSSIEEMPLQFVDSVTVFDVYRGGTVGVDAYSLGLSITYRAPDRTLTDDEVSGTHSQLVQMLVDRFGANLR